MLWVTGMDLDIDTTTHVHVLLSVCTIDAYHCWMRSLKNLTPHYRLLHYMYMYLKAKQ
jgi:hypothetical protein